MHFLLENLRKEQLQQCFALVLMILLGLFLFVFFLRENALVAAIGFGVFLVGIRFLFISIKNLNNERQRLVQVLFEYPERVVWVYTVVTQRMPFGFQVSRNGLLYLKMVDGEEISLSMPEKKLKLSSKFLNKLLPHATFGYSEERAQWYLAHPEMLRKN